MLNEPFSNESEVAMISGLTIENRLDRVSLYGSLDLTNDESGLIDALALKQAIDDVVANLQAKKDKGTLEVKVKLAQPQEVNNPFS